MQEASVRHITYTFIPCDLDAPLSERRFTGDTDEELRSDIGRHFLQFGMSTAGQEDFKATLLEKAKEQKSAEVSEEMLAAAMSAGGGFDIVPVVYPSPSNAHTATSLYIDNTGTFKELALNERASKIAQRKINGDAFLLRCVDNDAADEWYRIDTTVPDTEALIATPPAAAPSPTEQMQRLQAMMSQTNTSTDGTAAATKALPAPKEVSEENVKKAAESRLEGNRHFKESAFEEALLSYNTTLMLVDGTVPPEQQTTVAELQQAAASNRAMCYLKLRQWGRAEADCTRVLESDPRNVKALHRRATARCEQLEFEGALDDVRQGLDVSPDDTSFIKLEKDIRKKAAQSKQRQSQQMAKMFA